jgi:hypothetical protein
MPGGFPLLKQVRQIPYPDCGIVPILASTEAIRLYQIRKEKRGGSI